MNGLRLGLRENAAQFSLLVLVNAMVGAMVGVAERLRLESYLMILGTMGNNAPFVGLSGTVLGIIKPFHDLAASGGGRHGQGQASAHPGRTHRAQPSDLHRADQGRNARARHRRTPERRA